MIRKSFVFIDGIGARKERNLWKTGIEDWESFLSAKSVKGFSSARKAYADRQIHCAKKALFESDAGYFAKRLPSSESWRAYDHFKDEALFLDIETTGLKDNSITVVGLSDGYEYRPMIKGVNLDAFRLHEHFARCKMLVTFNGASFDLPVLSKFVGIPQVPHLDLKHASARIGLKGGLKEIERTLGFARTPMVDGLHGGDALSLWKIYRATGDRHYLDILLEYNEEDTVNLRLIADYVVRELTKSLEPIEVIS
ncbi:MAG: exonuclease [Nanoarchaeota archaeon]|nr:MAG: exonuclease [Nanoarchaeota archaeon]